MIKKEKKKYLTVHSGIHIIVFHEETLDILLTKHFSTGWYPAFDKPLIDTLNDIRDNRLVVVAGIVS